MGCDAVTIAQIGEGHFGVPCGGGRIAPFERDARQQRERCDDSIAAADDLRRVKRFLGPLRRKLPAAAFEIGGGREEERR